MGSGPDGFSGVGMTGRDDGPAWHADPMAGLPLTLIVGSERVLVDRALAQARTAARDTFGRDPDRREITLGDDEAKSDLLEALSPTLFGEPTLIILRDADKFEDPIFAVVEQALANPPEGVALVVLHPGGVKGKKFLTALRAAGAEDVACPAIKKGRETSEFLAGEVRRHGRKSTPEALRALQEAVGHDLPLLVGAIAQLCSDVESGPITEEHVHLYFAGVADMQGYRISDAVWERRPVDALRDLRWSAQSIGRGGVGPAVTAAVASGLRNIAKVQSLPSTMSDADVKAETGISQDWMLRNIRARAKRWRPDRLARAAVTLSDLDVAMKGGLRRGEALDSDQKLHELEEYVVRTASRVDPE